MNAILLNAGWRFHYGEASGAEAPGFDDSRWEQVTLPFDYTIRLPFDSRNSPNHGFLPGGTGWYRRDIALPVVPGRRYFIDFEGVYQHSRVWCNGHLLGYRPSGFAGFEYDLTPYLIDGKGTIAVRSEVPAPCCRWYPGGGICRDVRLFDTGASRFVRHGLRIRTLQLTPEAARLAINAEVAIAPQDAGALTLQASVTGPDGFHAAVQAPAGGPTATMEVDIPAPRFWSPEAPQLYAVTAKLLDTDGAVQDALDTTWGLRTAEFTYEDGFHLNGRRVQLQGVCLHENFGCLGAANYRGALARQLRLLKAMGCNAIRTSHNPQSPMLLELCDQMGLLVMDECFDEWRISKGADGYRKAYAATSPNVEATIRYWAIPEGYRGYSEVFDEWAERDLTEFIRRDRNHPSVILWSIGNEIPDQVTDEGKATSQWLLGILRRQDATRPVTNGVSSPIQAMEHGFTEGLDVFGLNYVPPAYRKVHEAGYKLVATETVAAEYCRGEYLFNTAEHIWRLGDVHRGNIRDYANERYINTDGLNGVPPFGGHSTYRDSAFMMNYAGNPPELGLATQKHCPYSAGEFIWSGLDYLGEPFSTHNGIRWPQRSAHSGLLDTAGFPKEVYYLYQSQWSSRPMAYLMPHWSWPDAVGHALPVRCFTNGDTAELFLNGRSLGTRRIADTPRPFLEWIVEYEPGELKVVVTKEGAPWAEYIIQTAGEPVALELAPECTAFGGQGDELCFVTIRAVDDKGVLTPEANFPVLLDVLGEAAVLAGVDNGESICHDAFTGNMIHLYHGLALAVLRAIPGRAGTVTLAANDYGKRTCRIELQVKK